MNDDGLLQFCIFDVNEDASIVGRLITPRLRAIANNMLLLLIAVGDNSATATTVTTTTFSA
jgi:hypothetical protein